MADIQNVIESLIEGLPPSEAEEVRRLIADKQEDAALSVLRKANMKREMDALNEAAADPNRQISPSDYLNLALSQPKRKRK